MMFNVVTALEGKGITQGDYPTGLPNNTYDRKPRLMLGAMTALDEGYIKKEKQE
jgi:hypothetical protein